MNLGQKELGLNRERIMMTLRQKLIQQLRSALNKLESPNEELVAFDIHDTEFEYLKEDLDKGVKYE